MFGVARGAAFLLASGTTVPVQNDWFAALGNGRVLGIPAIALAGLAELWALRKAGIGLHGWAILAFGLVIASISAFAAIWGLMRVLERFSAWPFVIYRFVLGVFLIVCVVTGLLPN